MKINRRITILVSISLLACSAHGEPPTPKITVQIDPGPNPWTSLGFKDDPKNFQFVIVTDRTGGVRPGIFEDAVTKINLLQPEFVISVGDLIMGGVQEQYDLDRQWDEFIGFVHELEMPFFYVPGNHDIYSEMTAREWKKRFGRDYYHFVYQDVLFLCLNSEDPRTHIGEAQTEYAKKALAENPDVRWTLVFLHKPLWAYEGEDTRWNTIEELLVGRKHTVFAGHWHDYIKFERNDSNYFVLATTGGGSQLRGPVWGEFDHVAWITMTDAGPVMANLLLSGIWDENVRTEDMFVAMMNVLSGKTVTGGSVIGDSLQFAGTKTKVRVENTADVPMTLQGSFRPHSLLKPGPEKLEATIPPNSIEWLEVDLQVDASISIDRIEPLHTDWKATYQFPRHEVVEISGTHPIQVDAAFPVGEVEAPIQVDGDPSEWKSFEYACEVPAQVAGQEYWTGPDDASFRFALMEDSDSLYIGVSAQDDFERSDPERGIEDKDGVRVRVDARPDPDRSHGIGQAVGEDTIEIQVCPGRTQESQVLSDPDKLPEGTKVVSIRSEKGYFTEIAIPHVYLNDKQGGTWKDVRLSLSMTDRDAEGRVTSIAWRPDWESPANFAGSGTFSR